MTRKSKLVPFMSYPAPVTRRGSVTGHVTPGRAEWISCRAPLGDLFTTPCFGFPTLGSIALGPALAVWGISLDHWEETHAGNHRAIAKCHGVSSRRHPGRGKMRFRGEHGQIEACLTFRRVCRLNRWQLLPSGDEGPMPLRVLVPGEKVQRDFLSTSCPARVFRCVRC